ncbi:MAG: GNAT family acetyltransferase [Telmatospirillum sp.]|nr:GNAT family acetyltransferase [Telmatospirillum sp.]
MGVLTIGRYCDADREPVIALWHRCGLIRSWNDPDKDIARKLAVQPEFFLVGRVGDVLAATAMAGYDGHRGWLNYLAVSPDFRHRGFGRRLVAEVERLLTASGCPKLSLQIRSSNREVMAFYRALGYVEDEVVCMGRRLIPD